MTRTEALDIILDIAGRWSENAEESLPRRLNGTETDEELAELVKQIDFVDEATEQLDLERAKDVRDTIKAIGTLRMKRGESYAIGSVMAYGKRAILRDGRLIAQVPTPGPGYANRPTEERVAERERTAQQIVAALNSAGDSNA